MIIQKAFIKMRKQILLLYAENMENLIKDLIVIFHKEMVVINVQQIKLD